MGAAIKALVRAPALTSGRARGQGFVLGAEALLLIVLALGIAAGSIALVSVFRLSEEVDRLGRVGVSSLQLSHEITRRTLVTGLRSYEALARAEGTGRPGQHLTEVEMLVDSLSRILQQNLGAETSRLVWLQEIRAAKDAYVAVLTELLESVERTGEIDPFLLYHLGSKGDVLISKAEAFQRVLSEELSLRAREIESIAGLAKAAAVASAALVLVSGGLVTGVRRRRRRAAPAAGREMAETCARLSEIQARLAERAFAIDRSLMIGEVHRSLVAGALERSKRAVDRGYAAAEESVRIVSQLQERVDRLDLAIRGLVGIVDQASLLALTARLEENAAIADDIGLLADRGVAAGDEIRSDLARAKEAADLSAAALAKATAAVREIERQAENVEEGFAGFTGAAETMADEVAAFRAEALEGTRLTERLIALGKFGGSLADPVNDSDK